MALLKVDIRKGITIQEQKNRIDNHTNTFRPTISFASKTSKIMTKKTIHSFHSVSMCFTDKTLVPWNDIINCILVRSVKSSINVRNVLTKILQTLRTSISYIESNKFLSLSVYSSPKPYFFLSLHTFHQALEYLLSRIS